MTQEDQIPEYQKACPKAESKLDCKEPHKQVYAGMDGERYQCETCGYRYFLDYDDMK